MHNAFIKLTRHLKGIEEIRCHKTKSFMVIIIRNVSLNMLEKEKKNAPADNIEAFSVSAAFSRCKRGYRPFLLRENKSFGLGDLYF